MAANTITLAKGGKVRVDHEKYPGIWTIERVNPVNCVLVRDQDGARLRCPKAMIISADAAAPAVADARIPWQLATVVRYTGPGTKVERTLYVVMDDKGGHLVRCIKMGADGGRYWRLEPRYLSPVDAGEIVAAYKMAGSVV